MNTIGKTTERPFDTDWVEDGREPEGFEHETDRPSNHGNVPAVDVDRDVPDSRPRDRDSDLRDDDRTQLIDQESNHRRDLDSRRTSVAEEKQPKPTRRTREYSGRLPKAGDNDYATIWWEHHEKTGGNPQHEALRNDIYAEAIERLKYDGFRDLPANEQDAEIIEDWILEQYLQKVSKSNFPDESIFRRALKGHIAKLAIQRVDEGTLPITGDERATAAAIEKWVRREFAAQIEQL